MQWGLIYFQAASMWLPNLMVYDLIQPKNYLKKPLSLMVQKRTFKYLHASYFSLTYMLHISIYITWPNTIISNAREIIIAILETIK